MAAVSVAPPASRAALTVAVGKPRRRCSLLADPAGSVGDLAVALGLDRRRPIWIDGRRFESSTPLACTGIVTGSRVDVDWPLTARWWCGGDADRPVPDEGRDGGMGGFGESVVSVVDGSTSDVTVVRCVAGPAAGGRWALAPGDYVLGRGGSSVVRVADPAIEPHALLLEVGDDGEVTVLQLTGRHPVMVGVTPLHGATGLAPNVPLLVGASRFEVGEPCGVDPHALTTTAPTIAGVRRRSAGPWSQVWRRAAREPLAHVPVPSSKSFDELRQAFVTHHRRRTQTIDGALDAIANRRPSLWSRRPDDGDAYTVSLGRGPIEWMPAVAKRARWRSRRGRVTTLLDEPVGIDLGPGASVALVGDDGSLARSLVVQLAANAGPADWSLVVVTDDPARWAWTQWLPHVDRPPVGSDGREDAVATHDSRGPVFVGGSAEADVFASASVDGRRAERQRHVVVVVDARDKSSIPGTSLRAVLDAHPAAALVAVASDPSPIMRCRTVVAVGAQSHGSWTSEDGGGRPHPVHLSGLDLCTAVDAARRLAPLVDPELTASCGLAALAAVHADHVSLAELIAQGPAASDVRSLRARWQLNEHARALACPIGVTLDGAVDVDLVADGPHAMAEGGIGGHASDVLRDLVVGLAARYPPDRLQLVLVDGADHVTFDAAVVLPHVVEHLDRHDEDRVRRLVSTIGAEIRRRQERLDVVGASDLVDYDALQGDDGRHLPVMPRLLVVVDTTTCVIDGDGADELVAQLCQLVGEAGHLGMHLVLGVRSGGGSDVAGDARDAAAAVCRLQITTDVGSQTSSSKDTWSSVGAPVAVVRRRDDKSTAFWLARCTGPDTGGQRRAVEALAEAWPHGFAGGERSEMDVIVRTICRVADVSRLGAGGRPWLEPLPDALPRDGFDGALVPVGSIGLVDDPANHRRAPLRWDPADGSLALIGSVDSGTSSTVLALLAERGDATGRARSTGSSRRSRSPAPSSHWIVDGDPDGRLAAALDLHDGHRLVRIDTRQAPADDAAWLDVTRLLKAMRRELDTRRASAGGSGRPTTLVVDGIDAWCSRPLAGGSTGERYGDVLGQLAADGPVVGITVIVAGEQGPAMTAIASRCAVRWLFSVDRSATALDRLGVDPRLVPVQRPGRCLDLSTGLYAQVVVPRARRSPGGRAVG